MKYSKPSLLIADQISHLEFRGLVISDRSLAEHFLSNISYYRFHGVPKLFYSEYDESFLEKIFAQIRDNKKAETCFVYFNNTASLAALRNARYFKQLASE